MPLTYFRIFLTADMWVVVGLAKNWQTVLTAKEISGRVQVRYCKPPTSDLYRVGLSRREPSVLVMDREEDIGVADGLHPSIEALWSKSRAYFCWDNSMSESL